MLHHPFCFYPSNGIQLEIFVLYSEYNWKFPDCGRSRYICPQRSLFVSWQDEGWDFLIPHGEVRAVMSQQEGKKWEFGGISQSHLLIYLLVDCEFNLIFWKERTKGKLYRKWTNISCYLYQYIDFLRANY